MGALHFPSECRETQMPTSGCRSRVPPNQAATRPSLVSAIVEAWHSGNGAVSKRNSDFIRPLGVPESVWLQSDWQDRPPIQVPYGRKAVNARIFSRFMPGRVCRKSIAESAKIPGAHPGFSGARNLFRSNVEKAYRCGINSALRFRRQAGLKKTEMCKDF